MDFDIKKPSHIISLLLIFISFIMIIGISIISYFGYFSSTETTEITELSEEMEIIFEIFLLFTQLIFVIILLILFPIIWYLVVNKYKLKEILTQLKLKKEGIGSAIYWGFIAIIFMFVVFIIIEIIVTTLGFQTKDQGNIEEIEAYFSPLTLFLLLAIQPTAEEIFFRGFLLDKLKYIGGNYFAIALTAILFGLAHLSNGKIYPAFITAVLGVILALIVIKTKNLYTAIIAHTGYNIISYVLYLAYY